MTKIMIAFTADDIRQKLPYMIIAETRFGARWNTMHRRRRWSQEFTESERNAARAIFSKAYSYALTKGVPDSVTMTMNTYSLWQRLGNFCASI